MGARVNYNIKQADGYYLNLYSHWGEYSRFMDVAYALDKARPRWSDESYCARIIISNLIGPEWAEETGFGLWASQEPSYDNTWMTIDMSNKTVEDETGTHDWDSYINYHMPKVVDKVEDAVV